MTTPKEMAQATLDGLKALLSSALTPLNAKLAELTARIDGLPVPKDGKDGEPGAVGPQGEIGPEGPAGKDGIPGEKGLDGKDGMSVDVDALHAKALALLNESIASMEKQAGEIIARKLLELKDGQDGKRGPQGEPGRDALHISIESMLDETRSYPRGTFAHHKGGLWRALKTTEGMDGWECIVVGVDTITHEKTGDREITATTTLSNGTKSALVYKFHEMRHRGTYSDDETYDEGDGVAWGGCQWIARVDGIKGARPIEANADKWSLSAKKGNDGASAWHAAKKAGFQGSEYDFGKLLIAGVRK